MPSYTGRFEFLAPGRAQLDAGPCELSFDDQTLTLVPQAGAPLSCDLGDIDAFEAGDYELQLTLYTGQVLRLTHFAKALATLAQGLLQTYRDRQVRCLLVSDLQEVARFTGAVRLEPGRQQGAGSAEVRLYESNVAVLPDGAAGFQWRLAEIDGVEFDDQQYAVILRRGPERLSVGRLAKRTGELAERLKGCLSELTQRSARALHALLPFLTPDQFRQVAALLREGTSAPLARLRAVHRLIEPAFLERVVDAQLKPYVAALAGRAVGDGGHVGFKIIRQETGEPGPPVSEGAPSAIPAEGGEAEPSTEETGTATGPDAAAVLAGPGLEVLYWFLFPLAVPGAGAASHVAWEATSRSGRATYVFAIGADDSVAQSIAGLNRGLLALNFRREPIYLGSDVLESDIRYRHYAIAQRRLPELRRVRQAFVGRAIHTTRQAWAGQLDTLVRGA